MGSSTKNQGLSLSAAELDDAVNNAYYAGFTGVTCTNCGATVNVQQNIENSQWTCPSCGSINRLDIGQPKDLHETPNHGPTRQAITAANKRREDRLAPRPAHDESRD